jgi:hypothetical protein
MPQTEVEIVLPGGAQLILDSESPYHAVWHPGDRPRYAVIASFATTDDLDDWIRCNQPR